MKLIGLAVILAWSALACQRKEDSSAAKPDGLAAAETASFTALAPDEKKEERPASKPTKASERPAVTEKKPPVAEPVAEKPGYVKSPFSDAIFDVKGIPEGTLVADPMFPASEKKHFRVPKMSPEDQAKVEEEARLRALAEETAKQNAPLAESVPDKPGFIFSPYAIPDTNAGPYDRVVIDASGLEPGSVSEDPSSTPDEPRYFKVPGGKAPAEDD